MTGTIAELHLLSVPQAARLCGLAEKIVRTAIHAEELVAQKVGASWVIKLKNLERWIGHSLDMSDETDAETATEIQFSLSVSEARALLKIVAGNAISGDDMLALSEKVTSTVRSYYNSLADDTHALDEAIAEAKADLDAFDGCEPPEVPGE